MSARCDRDICMRHCQEEATHYIRHSDGVRAVQPYSNADGTRSPLALCENHAMEFVEIYATLYLQMEPIEVEL